MTNPELQEDSKTLFKAEQIKDPDKKDGEHVTNKMVLQGDQVVVDVAKNKNTLKGKTGAFQKEFSKPLGNIVGKLQGLYNNNNLALDNNQRKDLGDLINTKGNQSPEWFGKAHKLLSGMNQDKTLKPALDKMKFTKDEEKDAKKTQEFAEATDLQFTDKPKPSLFASNKKDKKAGPKAENKKLIFQTQSPMGKALTSGNHLRVNSDGTLARSSGMLGANIKGSGLNGLKTEAANIATKSKGFGTDFALPGAGAAAAPLPGFGKNKHEYGANLTYGMRT